MSSALQHRRGDAALASAIMLCILLASLGGKRAHEVAFSVISLSVLVWTTLIVRRTWLLRERVALGTTDVVYRRVAAHILDWIVPGIVWLAVLWVTFELAWRTGISAHDYQRFTGHGGAALAVLLIADFVVLQATTGYTVGKWLLGIRTVDESGVRPGLRRTVVRTLPLLIEQFGLVALFAMARSPRHQRYGDRFAHTLVVRT